MVFFHFPNHILKWKHLINRRVQVKKVFWHMILHSYLCNALCEFCIKIKSNNVFPKHIVKLKARDESIQARKKLFCHVILLYCSRTVRSSHWRCSIKKAVLKNFAISTRNTCVRVSFLKSCRSEDPNSGVFLWILKKF